MNARLCAVALFAVTLLVASPVFAQFDSQNDGGALTISVDPAYPGPGQRVTLTAQSPLFDLSASDIEWTVNGSPAGSGTSITTVLKAAGSVSTVGVSVSGPSGSDSTEVSIAPTSMDLLFEASTYVPPLYLGRALPSSGSAIRVLAVPHFIRPDGSSIPSSDIIFTWKNNGATLASLSGIGENSAVIPAAILFGSDAITVDARSFDGSLSGEASLSVRTQDPQLLLYEVSPLFGVMYHRAMGQIGTASESESSFAAIPYLANARGPNDSRLAYDWSVNGASIAADAQNPNEVTIAAQGPETAQIDLSISNPSDPFVSASGEWNISFAQSGSSASDAFHAAQQ